MKNEKLFKVLKQELETCFPTKDGKWLDLCALRIYNILEEKFNVIEKQNDT